MYDHRFESGASMRARVEARRRRHDDILALPEAQGAYRALAEQLAEEGLLTVKEVQERLIEDEWAAQRAAAQSDVVAVAAYEASRLAGDGLGGAGAPKPALRVDIVATMRARYPTAER